MCWKGLQHLDGVVQRMAAELERVVRLVCTACDSRAMWAAPGCLTVRYGVAAMAAPQQRDVRLFSAGGGRIKRCVPHGAGQRVTQVVRQECVRAGRSRGTAPINPPTQIYSRANDGTDNAKPTRSGVQGAGARRIESWGWGAQGW